MTYLIDEWMRNRIALVDEHHRILESLEAPDEDVRVRVQPASRRLSWPSDLE